MSQTRIDALWARIRVIDEEAAHRVRTMPLNETTDMLFVRAPYVSLPIRKQAELAELQAERAFLVDEIRDLERGVSR